jgi:hypothetical protein
VLHALHQILSRENGRLGGVSARHLLPQVSRHKTRVQGYNAYGVCNEGRGHVSSGGWGEEGETREKGVRKGERMRKREMGRGRERRGGERERGEGDHVGVEGEGEMRKEGTRKGERKGEEEEGNEKGEEGGRGDVRRRCMRKEKREGGRGRGGGR